MMRLTFALFGLLMATFGAVALALVLLRDTELSLGPVLLLAFGTASIASGIICMTASIRGEVPEWYQEFVKWF